MAAAQSNKEIQKMSFEDALEVLKEIVSTLEGGYDLHALAASAAAHVAALMAP